MKEAFRKFLAEWSDRSDIKRRHSFLMLYLNNGSVFTAFAEDGSGDGFQTHLFSYGHSLPHRCCVTLIPVDPHTHMACPKSSVMVDLHSFCGIQWVDPETLRKMPLHDPGGPLGEPANDNPDVQEAGPEGDCEVLCERAKTDGPTTVIPFGKIKKVTIRPPNGE